MIYCFFRKYFNITTHTLIDFSVGVFEGAVETNLTTKGAEAMSDPAVGLVQQKTKKILIIAAGGAIKQTPLILGTVAKTIAGATLNLPK
jgi:hypothetical protein